MSIVKLDTSSVQLGGGEGKSGGSGLGWLVALLIAGAIGYYFYSEHQKKKEEEQNGQ